MATHGRRGRAVGVATKLFGFAVAGLKVVGSSHRDLRLAGPGAVGGDEHLHLAVGRLVGGGVHRALEREAARRIDCGNRQRQLAQAVSHYANANSDVLPVGSHNSEWKTWAISLLPFLEHADLHGRYDVRPYLTETRFNVGGNAVVSATPIPLLSCPSHGWAMVRMEGNPVAHNYVGCTGNGLYEATAAGWFTAPPTGKDWVRLSLPTIMNVTDEWQGEGWSGRSTSSGFKGGRDSRVGQHGNDSRERHDGNGRTTVVVGRPGFPSISRTRYSRDRWSFSGSVTPSDRDLLQAMGRLRLPSCWESSPLVGIFVACSTNVLPLPAPSASEEARFRRESFGSFPKKPASNPAVRSSSRGDISSRRAAGWCPASTRSRSPPPRCPETATGALLKPRD